MKKMKKNRRHLAALTVLAAMALALAMALTACGNGGEPADAEDPASGKASGGNPLIAAEDVSKNLTFDHAMELDYAEGFSVDYYKEGCVLLSIVDGGQYLLVPEGEAAPEDLPEGITVLQQPVSNVYLVASAVMDMYASIDAVDQIRFSALKESGWYVDAAKKAMGSGDLLYAGKYSAPDYELILSEGCGLAIENTMILHSPDVKEQLEGFGIPVLVDRSSYEASPQGRMEWVKLYGVISGKEAEAKKVFDEQVQAIEAGKDGGDGTQTVAFFYITSNGGVNVRKSSDYLPKMIRLAGGKYIFDDLGDEDDMASSTMTMQMEDFYAAAKDADYMVYNSSIEGELPDLKSLLSKSPLLEKCKAVKDGHVYCTTKNLYQASMELGTMIGDFSCMFTGRDDEMTYMYQLK